MQVVRLAVDLARVIGGRLRRGRGDRATFVGPLLERRLGLLAARRGRGRLQQPGQAHREVAPQVAEVHEILRSLRSGDARDHRGEVEFDRGVERRLRRVRRVEESLGAAVLLDQRHRGGVTPGALEVLQRFGVDREKTAGGTVLGRHVRNGGAVGERELCQARPVELHELVDHAMLAQHLGDREDQVSRRAPGWE